MMTTTVLPLWLWDQEAFRQNVFYWHNAAARFSMPEKVFRTVAVYAALVFLLRVFGKRELAQLNPFDLVVLLLLSNSVQNAIIGSETTLTGGLLGATTLLITNYCVVRFVFKHKRLDQLLEGSPSVLIAGGEIQEQALARELLSESELSTVAHRQGFAPLPDVETCTLEPGAVFYMQGKEPSTRETQYAALLARLDEISRQLEDLKRRDEKGMSENK